MKNQELKMTIQELKTGSLIWNVCGLTEITEIIKIGYSDLVGSYCHAKTRFSKDSTLTFFICQEKAAIKDGYLYNTDHKQFIEKHKVEHFNTAAK
jgi:hypothetical protein